jgi:hypothetical protein
MKMNQELHEPSATENCLRPIAGPLDKPWSLTQHYYRVNSIQPRRATLFATGPGTRHQAVNMNVDCCAVLLDRSAAISLLDMHQPRRRTVQTFKGSPIRSSAWSASHVRNGT